MTGLALTGLVCGAIGYGIGYQAARVDRAALNESLAVVAAERDKLQVTVTRLLADSHSANVRYQQIEEQLQSELPQEGPLKDIVRQIRGQLQAGVDPGRLASVVQTLNPPRNCADPETRRFIVQTSKNASGGAALLLAEGAISVQAVGEAAKTKDGKDEAWYDPSAPVALAFTVRPRAGADPQTFERKGNLPISQVTSVGNREYRMTFSEGARSFIKVTFDVCDLR
jgi:hypothetical protein